MKAIVSAEHMRSACDEARAIYEVTLVAWVLLSRMQYGLLHSTV